jgi:hypothetical protein
MLHGKALVPFALTPYASPYFPCGFPAPALAPRDSFSEPFDLILPDDAVLMGDDLASRQFHSWLPSYNLCTI